jgi:hypothetical protein
MVRAAIIGHHSIDLSMMALILFRSNIYRFVRPPGQSNFLQLESGSFYRTRRSICT